MIVTWWWSRSASPGSCPGRSQCAAASSGAPEPKNLKSPDFNRERLTEQTCHTRDQLMSRKGQVRGYTWESTLFLNGTGPLACLSLFPVADLDKVSND